MKKTMGWMMALVLLCFLTISEVSVLSAADSTTVPEAKRQSPPEIKGSAAEAKSDATDTEARIQAAEQRAREAEAAAAKAASEARAAQDQAAQAMEAARRANESLARLQETLTRIEQSTGGAAQTLTVLKQVNGQPTAEAKTIRTSGQAPAQTAAAPKPTEGAMTTVSNIPAKFYGNILLNSNYVDRGSNNNDIPFFAVKARTEPFDQNHQNFNMTLRQSRFGVRYNGKIFSDADLTGVFEFDLLGGMPSFTNGIHFDLFRLRLAYGRIDWAKNSIEVGQDWTVFSPLNPTTLATYAIPGFSTSGNLWNRLPQIRYEHREDIGDKAKFVWTSAIVDPNAGDNTAFVTARAIGLGERGSLPALESRLGFTTTKTYGKETSAGVSGHYSRFLAALGNPVGTQRAPIDSYGVSGDWNLWLLSGLRTSGEFFHGRALGIFSGNIIQSAILNPTAGLARGINSTGGWAEIHVEAPTGYDGLWKKFSVNAGYGAEDNRGKDLLFGLRKHNQTYMVNGQYKFSPTFTFAIEYRQILTDWQNQPQVNQKLNVGNVSFFYSF